ncbi:MAG: DUF3137 domain-containing protein [Sedimentisphaerales bacterium]|nr:DUF3137 domain-containing protein [Sedimentisphaerales bacterium]
MNQEQNLYNFYESQMKPLLHSFEQKRMKIAALLRNSAIILLTLAIIAAICIARANIAIMAGCIPFIVALVIWVILHKAFTCEYRLEFKQDIISELVMFIDPSLQFNPKKHIPQEIYDASMLFNQKAERFKGEDLVTGKIDKTQIAFSELHSEYSVKTKNGRNWHTIFKGLFFQADFNKHFQGFTLVLPDVSQRLFGGFGQKLQELFAFRGELVKLEDPQFEKMFSVYSSDQIEARYILTPALMQRLKDFALNNKQQVRISFVNACVFVAISLNKNLFEPRIYTSLLDFKMLQEYYDQLMLAIGIVDELNLNCRIWTKE